MSELFLSVINMSISAAWIVLAVLLLRLLFKKAPRWLMLVLWGIVAVRLVFPVSIESVLSLIPSGETVSPEGIFNNSPHINSGIPVINSAINPIIRDSFAPSPETGEKPLETLIPIFAAVWLAGIALLLIYAAIAYIRVKRGVHTAVLLRGNIYQCDMLGSAFVLGIIKPKIYIPFALSEESRKYVIAHEEAHIKRLDHLWKPFGFLLLAVHWFNPLLWLAYILLSRDIELACDERVIKELGEEERADYSEALLASSISRRAITACPLAFGEVGVKERVKSVLSYKKPAFWIIIAAAVICIVTAICFLTNPKDDDYRGAVTDLGVELISVGSECEDVNIDVLKIVRNSQIGLSLSLRWNNPERAITYGNYFKLEKLVDGNWEALEAEAVFTAIGYTVPPLSAADKLGNNTHREHEFDLSAAYGYINYGTYRFSTEFNYENDPTSHRVFAEFSVELASMVYDAIEFDIDNDGRDELCVLEHGRTSGLFTFRFGIKENGSLEYDDVFCTDFFKEISFEKAGGKLYVKCLPKGDDAEVQLFKISFKDGHINLTEA